MREILFRAKRLDNGEWVQGLLWRKKYKSNKLFISCFPNEDDDEECFVVDSETVGQFTGLTDKNRQKIFEGDIVSFRHRKSDFDIESEYPFFISKEYNRNYVIEFSNTTTHYGLRFKNGSITFPCKRGTLINGDCKVIGNIFDNPELLKEGAE